MLIFRLSIYRKTFQRSVQTGFFLFGHAISLGQALLFLLAWFAVSVQVHAAVKRIVLQGPPQAPWALGNKSFGEIGTYQRIRGVAYGELDPANVHNSVIQDLS